MRIHDYLTRHRAKRLIAWILRPRLAFFRFREYLQSRQSRPVRSDIDLSTLPDVTLRHAVTAADLESVIRLYRRNPSPLIIAPRHRRALDEMLSRKTVFFKILDSDGNHVGNLGYQAPRRMFSYLQIDYRYRSRGYALAAELAGERVVALQGVDQVRAQIFRTNHRALSTFLSIGWQIDETESANEYFTLTKTLEAPATDSETK